MTRPDAPLVLLTRPRAGSLDFARALRRALGPDLPLLCSPLIRIAPRLAPGAAAGLIGAGEGAVFTSAQGVRAFRRAGGRGAGRPAFAVGAQTAQAARAAGFDVANAPPPGDAETLLVQLLAQPDLPPLVHLRGEVTRGDLAARLEAAGRPCREVLAYAQLPQPLRPGAQAALQGTRPIVLPLFSPRTAALFAREAARLGPVRAPLRVAAFSPAVAEAAKQLTLEALQVPRRPDTGLMLRTVAELAHRSPA